MRPAVFFDRDGTLIENVHYLSDPNLVRLIPGAAEAIAVLQQHGFACVIITNQSAVGRGLVSLDQLQAVNDEMHRQFSVLGVQLDGLYFCTSVPRTDDRTTVDDENRKPGPGMLKKAASDLNLTLSDSWMVGDMLSDILAGKNAGCRGSILVRTGQGTTVETFHPAISHVAEDSKAAANYILRQQNHSK